MNRNILILLTFFILLQGCSTIKNLLGKGSIGDPNDPEVYWQFTKAIEGIGLACKHFNTPVTGGNVSFYNETSNSAVFPTPVIGMIGILDNIQHATSISYQNVDDLIVAIGSLNGSLGGSEYLQYLYGKCEGPIANIDLDIEFNVQKVVLELIQNNFISSAHDLSDGGLAVNVLESIINAQPELGAQLNITSKLRDDELLFGECQSVIIVSIKQEHLHELALTAQKYNVHTQTIGRVTNNSKLIINDMIDIKREKFQNIYNNRLENILTNEK